MKSNDIRLTAQRLYKEGKSYNEIAEILAITRFSARNLVTYKLHANKKKRGCKNIITKSTSLSIKRELSRLADNQEKINAPKILRNLCLC